VGRAALVAAAVIVADQVAKAIVRANIKPGETVDVIPALPLLHTKNTGVAFSLFSGGGPLVVIVALIALGALVAFFVTHIHRRLVWLPTGLLIGGAAGNLIDRIRLGSVTDFIRIPHWPAFNVADIAVTVGVLTLLWVLEKTK